MLLRRARATAAALALVLSACAEDTPVGVTGTIELRSPAFAPMGTIPTKHARRPEGENVSPPLAWSKVPSGTKELLVLVDDPDAEAGTWTHWVVYGIPPTATGLPEGVPAEPAVLAEPVGAVQGRNSGGDVGWTGPSPSPGKAHKVQFWVYALNARLSLPAGATRAEVQRAMQGHVLGNGRFVALYGK
jgi:Raf kinase inhibitor-like YbhB/YbcL family protein